MATVRINDITDLNNSVLDLKSKVTSSLSNDISSLNATLSNVTNYSNNGFKANVGDAASTLKNNLNNILNDMANSEENIFNYVSIINKFNVDDYDAESEAVDLTKQYNALYVDKNANENNKKADDKNEENKQSKEDTENNDSKEEQKSNDSKEDSGNDNEPNNTDDNTENGNTGNGNTGNGNIGGGSSGNNNTTNLTTEIEKYLQTVEGQSVAASSTLIATPIVIDLATNSSSTLSSTTTTIMSGVTYNNDALATFNGRYVISVPSGFGNIGDVIDIKQSDGTVLKCIIGQVEENTNTTNIGFVVNKNTYKNSLETSHPNWLKSIVSVKNKGNYFAYMNLVK